MPLRDAEAQIVKNDVIVEKDTLSNTTALGRRFLWHEETIFVPMPDVAQPFGRSTEHT